MSAMYLPKDDLRDVAQVCVNGHLVNPASTKNIVYNKKYCEICSASVITQCSHCSKPIHGPYPFLDGKEQNGTTTAPGLFLGASISRSGVQRDWGTPDRVVPKYKSVPTYEVFEEYSRPNFCAECGEPYPWTVAHLQAARELADEDEELTEEDKAKFDQNLAGLLSDTPQTAVAATRVKRILAKVGAGTAESIKKIIVDVATEGAKKLMFPS